MTKKISKKDKLDAMLQMWNVLRAQHGSKRPWSSDSKDYKLMISLETELASMLGVTAEIIKTITNLLSRKEVEVILSELDKVDEELTGQLLHADGRPYFSQDNSRLNLLREQLRKKLEAVPVPANFEEEPEKYVEKKKTLIKGDVAEAPTSSENEEADEPATPQPEQGYPEDEYEDSRQI